MNYPNYTLDLAFGTNVNTINNEPPYHGVFGVERYIDDLMKEKTTYSRYTDSCREGFSSLLIRLKNTVSSLSIFKSKETRIKVTISIPVYTSSEIQKRAIEKCLTLIRVLSIRALASLTYSNNRIVLESTLGNGSMRIFMEEIERINLAMFFLLRIPYIIGIVNRGIQAEKSDDAIIKKIMEYCIEDCWFLLSREGIMAKKTMIYTLFYAHCVSQWGKLPQNAELTGYPSNSARLAIGTARLNILQPYVDFCKKYNIDPVICMEDSIINDFNILENIGKMFKIDLSKDRLSAASSAYDKEAADNDVDGCEDEE